ncbi:MAG: pyrroline-5-carboxylate reductase [Xanthobacteraceae bacterium]
MNAAKDNGELRELPGPLILIGAGKMGGVLLEGWLNSGLDPTHIAVVEPQPAPAISALVRRGIQLNPNVSQLAGAAAIVIAVKPQAAAEALATAKPSVAASTVVLSIMAGRTLQSLADGLPPGCALVRAMPNLPAAIGQGITVAVAKGANEEQRKLADRLLSATGSVEWIENEALMDAVTAVSGSGPAYVFLLAEALARAAVESGLPPDLSEKLARETISGSGELLRRGTADAASLRENVTSPGGTTAAALAILMGPEGLVSLMTRAVAAATDRSRELAD